MVFYRVLTNLESQGKSGKIKWSGKIREFISPKSEGFKKNSNHCEIKKCRDFHLKNFRLSFHAPGKTS